jgi:two-component system response regulator RegX3
MSAHLLIADEDRDLAEAVAWYLRAEGLRVTVVTEAAKALAVMADDPPHAAVVDAAIAGADGFAQVTRLRRGAIPVLVLAADQAEGERVRALNLGHEYAARPLGPMEVAARARGLLRRSGILHEAPRGVPGLEVRLTERQVAYHGSMVPLSPREFDLLTILMAQPTTALTRAQIADALWGDDYYGDLRLVDWHVARLRRRLRLAGLPDTPVVTVRGVGYAFEPGD